jgi:cytochrome c-type protein NapC
MPQSKSSSTIKYLLLAAGIFLAGIVFAGAFNAGLAYTNEMEFCTSCHSMKTNLEELKDTAHHMSRSGVAATCSDCHVPQPFVPKMVAKIHAAKDVYHEIMGTVDTEEKFEQHRWRMANRVWDKMRASDSRECRSCHDFANMDLTEQSRSARSQHGKAVDSGETCIDCHKGVAHEEPDDPNLWGDLKDSQDS